MADYTLTANGGFKSNITGTVWPSGRTSDEYVAWLAAGNIPDPYIAPVEPQLILSQNLMAQFTADDAAKIRAAVEGNAQFWLLWSSLQAQKDPMIVGNARFAAGWNALVQVLGADRMAAIATALGVTL